jgi:hypothetical protein
LASTHTCPLTRRASAAHAPSYDHLVAPPTLHPVAPTFCSCDGLFFVPCVVPPAVSPAGFVCDIVRVVAPPSLHSCRVPPLRTWRLLRRSSPATTHSRGVLLVLCKHDWHGFGDCYRPLRVHRLLLRRLGVIVFLLCAFVAFIIVSSCRRPL